ncbi:YfcL family protein [Thalassotalea mangrovi]|uniref:YfcL family protein n=1 Tax=Thalassotalea mangrovi TaxID=2572245 RepID=A0A4U1B492_9GAMM|nr:YfcL family protein [Thalassotalea mangrovi]TKB45083.1 YfcL family protein [Thalassotalea mangrovi]
MMNNINNLEQLCDYFDGLIEHDDADLLFASSYVRGFILIAANDASDEEQPLTAELADRVSAELHAARSELTPQDKVIVDNFWQQIQPCFC